MVKRSREDSGPVPSLTNQSSRASSESQYSSPSSQLSTDAPEAAKIPHVDTENSHNSPATEVMRCSLPPHRQTISFNTYEEYEVHYNKTHVNRCVECHKNFPTGHLLNLHLSENHNPLAEVLKERGERTYACFVEDCDKLCSTPQKRRLHLIDKHMFPKDYDFYVVNDGIDQRNSMLRTGRHRRKSSAVQHKLDMDARARLRTVGEDKGDDHGDTPEDTTDMHDSIQETDSPIDATPADEEMDGLTSAMSSLKFVPPSIRFGRGKGKGRGGFSRS